MALDYESGSDRTDRTRYIPADRLGLGAPGDLSVADNILLRLIKSAEFSRRGFLDRKKMDETVRLRAAVYNIKIGSSGSPTKTLSGGNIQRVIAARELEGDFDFLVAQNPTAGLDIRAQHFVRAKIREKKETGCGVLLISTELDEILELADRILVLFEGKSMGVFNAADISRADVCSLMVGVSLLVVTPTYPWYALLLVPLVFPPIRSSASSPRFSWVCSSSS